MSGTPRAPAAARCCLTAPSGSSTPPVSGLRLRLVSSIPSGTVTATSCSRCHYSCSKYLVRFTTRSTSPMLLLTRAAHYSPCLGLLRLLADFQNLPTAQALRHAVTAQNQAPVTTSAGARTLCRDCRRSPPGTDPSRPSTGTSRGVYYRPRTPTRGMPRGSLITIAPPSVFCPPGTNGSQNVWLLVPSQSFFFLRTRSRTA